MGLYYILINDETGQYLKGLDHEDKPLYTLDMKDAAVVDDFVVKTYWHDHTPATVTGEEMRALFGEVRRPKPFSELRIAEDRVQKKIERSKRPGMVVRLWNLIRRTT